MRKIIFLILSTMFFILLCGCNIIEYDKSMDYYSNIESLYSYKFNTIKPDEVNYYYIDVKCNKNLSGKKVLDINYAIKNKNNRTTIMFFYKMEEGCPDFILECYPNKNIIDLSKVNVFDTSTSDIPIKCFYDESKENLELKEFTKKICDTANSITNTIYSPTAFYSLNSLIARLYFDNSKSNTIDNSEWKENLIQGIKDGFKLLPNFNKGNKDYYVDGVHIQQDFHAWHNGLAFIRFNTLEEIQTSLFSNCSLLQKYNEAYFNDFYLVLVSMPRHSSSITYLVTDLKMDANHYIKISFLKMIPNQTNDDLQNWGILFEFPLSDYDCIDILISLNYINESNPSI